MCKFFLLVICTAIQIKFITNASVANENVETASLSENLQQVSENIKNFDYLTSTIILESRLNHELNRINFIENNQLIKKKFDFLNQKEKFYLIAVLSSAVTSLHEFNKIIEEITDMGENSHNNEQILNNLSNFDRKKKFNLV